MFRMWFDVYLEVHGNGTQSLESCTVSTLIIALRRATHETPPGGVRLLHAWPNADI